MDILLCGHGGSGNHGCEALVRSTCQIVRRSLPECGIGLASNKIEEDKYYGVDKCCNLHSALAGKRDFDFYLSYLKMKATRNYAVLDTYPIFGLLKHCPNYMVGLFIGGDNYCYGGTEAYAYLNRLFNRKGRKTILWGCSINPEVLEDRAVIDDLKYYSHIFARESITFEALISKGINHVSLCPDPAFTLFSKDSSNPINWSSDNTIGINVSPVVLSQEYGSSITFLNCLNLINYIIKYTDLNVLLIPHVVWSSNDDRIPMQLLYNKCVDQNRVFVAEDANSEEIKGYISKCRLMIAARTHASIAAYSTCVPTLVVGYSVKAKGIAKDIFGTYDKYVLPVQSLQTENDLLESFKWLLDNEQSIRKHLQEFMPDYISKAWEAGELLKSYI